MREHPREKALRRWGLLSPELRELIARAARSIAKDAVQDVMDEQGLTYDPGLSSRTGTLEPEVQSARHAATELIGKIIDGSVWSCPIDDYRTGDMNKMITHVAHLYDPATHPVKWNASTHMFEEDGR